MKAFSWVVAVFLILVIGGLVFVHFSPDYNMYMVQSGSMKPGINTGDMVVIGPVGGPFGGEVAPGTIVTYHHGSELVTHRIIAVDGQNLRTQGDAVEDPDPWAVTRCDVRGVYLFRIPGVGYVQNFIHTRTGWMVIVMIPATIFVVLLIREIRKRLRQSKDAAP